MQRVISSRSDLANPEVVSVDSLATRVISPAESGRREVNPSPKEFETWLRFCEDYDHPPHYFY
jgi:hypothetical protein